MELYYLLATSNQMYQKLTSQKLKNFNLSPGQPRILTYLLEYDGVNQSEISNTFNISQPSVSSVINGMEKDGLVQRRRKGKNKRSYFVFLTDKGRDLGEKTKEAISELGEGIRDGVTSAVYEQIKHLLLELNNQLMMMEKDG